MVFVSCLIVLVLKVVPVLFDIVDTDSWAELVLSVQPVEFLCNHILEVHDGIACAIPVVVNVKADQKAYCSVHDFLVILNSSEVFLNTYLIQ